MPARDAAVPASTRPQPDRPRGARRVAAALALTAVAPLAGVGCRRVDVPTYSRLSPPVLSAHPLTHDGADRFVHRAGRGRFRVLAAGDNVDRNTRLVLFPPGAPATTDQQSCATWSDETGRTTQQGVALRIRRDGERWRAITVTKNVWLGAPWNFNVHTWDSTDGGAWRLRGRVLLGRQLGPHGVALPLPWRVCARVEGTLVTLKVWPEAVPEPRWDDPGYTGTVRLPDGWEYPGRAGWYVGHLEPGATAGFETIETTARPLADG